MSRFETTLRAAVPPPPRMPSRLELPVEEITPVNTTQPNSGVTVGSGKGKIHIGTATVVAIVAAVAAGFGGRATAGGSVDPEDFREFKREVREEFRAVRGDLRALRRKESGGD